MIRLTRPEIDQAEIDAVSQVLSSGMLVQGPQVARFEALLAERCQRRHAVAVSSGTTALALALQAVGVGPGDEVLVPTLTWPSPAHAVYLAGATPVLVDVDLQEWNTTARAFSEARGPRTTAAIVIDQFGFPARHGEIREALSDLAIIEDAACALGATISGEPAGRLGVVACLSFHPRKILTTAEGGTCLTDDDAVAERLRVLRNHGQGGPGRFAEVSGNHRLSDVAAAMGVCQMGKLDRVLSARRARARALQEALPELIFQRPAPGAEPNYQTLGALLPEGTGLDRDGVLTRIRQAGVEAGLLSYGLHRVATLAEAARRSEARGIRFPGADAILDRGFALPLYPSMTDAQQEQVVRAVRSALEAG